MKPSKTRRPSFRFRKNCVTDVEIIILPLDEATINGGAAEVDENGYPIGFFEETAGSLADNPIERAPQGDYEMREKIK